MNSIISLLRNDLEQNSDEEAKASSNRFFKEPIKCYGMKTPVARKIAKTYYKQVSGKNKQEIFALCEELLSSDYMEEAFIAFEWSYNLRKQYEPEDFPMFERWVGDYVNNWAKCDTLCNHTIGMFIDMYPQYIDSLKKWTASENSWYRRAAAVTLILAARRGDFLDDIFEIADLLLTDEDDLVQKGYGWMLKEASKQHQKEVFDYVVVNKEVMPRTALRYAIEKMPKELRVKAMEK
ncbi:DNA alkylation repair protein [Methanolobus bombayensis]|uniref:DNA alkylation repair protein n=1 Tax=Methanolobus bombayensis TaxID=38023 RepID=UPI001AE54914|nr:DNA alkylation repair protein [Methanolobus bombayensis]MBP1909542.1 3-methyladenine DNA glycosylase AlkD [Methanolobus bombayensis]